MPIRITRVYTRTGDRGQTRLVGGRQVGKDAPRIEAYGTIDELNAAIGLVRAFGRRSRSAPGAQRLEQILRRVQNQLFDLGAEVATPPDAMAEGMYRMGANDVTELEHVIDECQRDLTPLRSFVLPGGGVASALLHHARTVCRRAEREIVRLGRTEATGQWPLKYLNRLGDLLFVLSRWTGKKRREAEFLWERPLRREAEKTASARPRTGRPTGRRR